jgi:hypothetical protein
MKTITRRWLLALGLIAAGTVSGSDVMRCSTHVIDPGTPRDEVVRHCGQPLAEKDGGLYWFYARHSSMTVTRVFFVDDQVEFIDEVSKDDM